MQGIKSDYCLRTYDDTNRDCPLGNGIFRSIEAFHQLMAYFFSAQRQYLKGRPYPSGYDNMFFIRRNTKRRQITPKRPVVLFFFVQNREIRICGKHL
ncbi:unknown [Paraprevotella clara CAG:116]|nr:unknown [Paraprevotella clara CAG:116]